MPNVVYCSGCYNRHDAKDCPFKHVARSPYGK